MKFSEKTVRIVCLVLAVALVLPIAISVISMLVM